MGTSRPPEASSEHVARGVLDSLHEGCQVIGTAFQYLYVNDAVVAQGRLSREQLLGRTMTECYPGIESTPMFGRIRRCMEERTHDRMENEFAYADGSTGWFELRFIPVDAGVCVLSLDITESKRASAALARTEEQLRHAQKMEAVGRLAGGVSHDFNNLLSVILSYSALLLEDLEPTDPHRDDIAEIQKAGARAAELTRQLLALTRQQVLKPQVLDLRHVLAGMERMLVRLLGADIELNLLADPSLGKVRADPGQIEQIVMNLAVNARDAMPRGGKLTIQAKDVYLDDDYAREHLGVTVGPHVMMAMTDTGIGMDKETRDRMFEPFFTTKGQGKGTGLGLSIVFGIVSQSGGHIWAYSEPGHGTTLKLYFPRSDATAPTASPEIARPATGGTETILLVEDDDQVRAVTCSILRRAGYTVLEAPGPGEALLVSEQFRARINLLLTDVVMPRMNGAQLADRLRTSRADIRVLFMSGYANEAVVQHGLLDSGAAFLQKPITPNELMRSVREALAAPIPTAATW